MYRGHFSLASLACGALLAQGCFSPRYGAQPFTCTESQSCPEGYTCIHEVCQAAPAPRDGPVPDSAPDSAPAREARPLEGSAPRDTGVPVIAKCAAALKDGSYLLDFDGAGAAPPFRVYCAVTADAAEAKTYLELSATGSSDNFAYYKYVGTLLARRGEKTCHWTKVLVEEVTSTSGVWSLRIKGDDLAFATCQETLAPNASGPVSAETRWGTAASCSCDSTACSSPAGRMNINLTGTPFRVRADVKWEATGYHPPKGTVTFDAARRKADAKGDGWCGRFTPAASPGLVLELVGE